MPGRGPTASLMRNDLLNTARQAHIVRSERVTKMLKVPPKAPKSEPKSRSLSETVLSDAVGTFQRVEKLLRAIF